MGLDVADQVWYFEHLFCLIQEFAMGGNALKTVSTRRLDAEVYHRLATQVADLLRETFGARAEVIPAYRQKADFGDLDVIVEKEKVLVPGDGYEALRAFAEKHGFAREFHANGSVLSYDHRTSASDEAGFQVDLILTPAAEMDAALAYFSYNDLGNLIGRTAHKMGFSYGHKGLLYPYREGTHLFRTIEITSDTDQALTFLGYAPERFHQGFENLQEIFDYVTGSRYFNRDIFLLENRNHASRVRDRKRKTYAGFLEHLEAHPELPAFEYPEDKSVWLPSAFAAFPLFKAAYDQTGTDLVDTRFVRSVFNGQQVMAWTGLVDKEVGAVMARVKDRFASVSEFAAFLRAEGTEGAQRLVMESLAAPRPSSPRPKV